MSQGFTVEEAIANLSWLGMIFGPLLIVIVCRLGDSRNNVFVYAVTVLVASLLLAVHLVAFATLFSLWLVLVIITGRINKKKGAG